MRCNFSKTEMIAIAKIKFGDDLVEVSDPYWFDFSERSLVCRVGILLKGDVSFGANYDMIEEQFI